MSQSDISFRTTKIRLLGVLFCEFFKIALLTIGGGLVMIPVIENTFVKKRHLLQESDITDMIGITQIIPGLIAVNSAVFVGHKLAGKWGSLIATTGVILPSMIIIIIIAALLPLEDLSNPHILNAFQYVRACVLGLFLVLALRIGRRLIKSIWDIPLMLILFGLLGAGFHPVVTVLSATILGSVYETYLRSRLTRGKK